ncbi:MAG: hypothetical protein M3Y05_15455 [Gemmatimonadota bacterium]|nr:hypothetical protein [Gemmatimonadota bacterium]
MAGLSTKKVAGLRILNHLLMGFEAWSLNTILSGRDDLTCLIFDGRIGGPVDTKAMEQLIYDEAIKQFGFPLSMRISEEALP